MDYHKHYEQLIERARNRVLDGYVERHHVLPRCMGGGDELTNLVALTPEEHFVAHQLLAKMHPKNSKLVYAMIALTMNKGLRCNKVYGWIKRLNSITQTEENIKIWKQRRIDGTDKIIAQRISDSNKGKKISEETKQKMSDAQIGIPRPWLHGKKQSADAIQKRVDKIKGKPTWNLGIETSAETKEKISAANKGYKHTEEAKAKISAGNKGQIPWIKGRAMLDEYKAKISAAQKGHKMPEAHKEVLRQMHIGKPMSEETKRKLLESHQGKEHSAETKAKIGAANKGRTHTEESRQKMRLGQQRRRENKKIQQQVISV